MTEHDWFTSEEPERLVESVRGKVSDRKLRLFACACCRAFWPLFPALPTRAAVYVTERHADGGATNVELTDAWRAAGMGGSVAGSPVMSARVVVRAAAIAARRRAGDPAWEKARKFQAALLRDIVGNPDRPVLLAPNCRAAVLPLAQAVYDERRDDGSLDPTRLAVLADALEESGCEEAIVLQALRDSVPRFRGFWALDAVLGKD